MGIGTIRTADLDAFVAECDRRGGLGTAATKDLVSDFHFVPTAAVDRSLDPFSEAYFGQQAALYREISGRAINQSDGEHTPVDVDAHAAAVNPYQSADVRVVAEHARAIQTCLVAADLPPGAAVLDMGCGWGLTSELIAFAGARVTAVDINPLFVDLVRRRAARLGLPIEAVASEFDTFADGRAYDLLLFYECLHHSLRPWVTLERLGPRVKAGGKIVWAGEPVNDLWWPHWGLRLDHESVYVMRKFGWWESGWSAGFISRCFARCGFALTVLPAVGLRGGPIGFAVRSEDAERVRPDASVVQLAGAFQARDADARRELASLRASRSWRLTAPLRAVGRLSHGLFGRR